MADLYPAFLNLAERETLVVGGGAVALRKVLTLLRAGAVVTVVSPEVCDGFSRLTAKTRKRDRPKENPAVQSGISSFRARLGGQAFAAPLAGGAKLRIVRREYRPTDLKDKWLAIAATDCAEVNRKVSADAARARIFCNVVDQPALCTFQVPAVVQRGLLQIAVSTSGASPGIARNIRRELEKKYGPGYSKLLTALLGLRRHFQRKYPDDIARRRLIEAFLKSPATGLLLRRGDSAAFQREVRRWKALY